MSIITNLYKFYYLFISLVVLMAIVFLEKRITFNPTISEPEGYYFTVTSSSYHRGEIVEICINKTRYIHVLQSLKLPHHNRKCEFGTAFLLKKIVATEGDVIDVTKDGVFINGVVLPNSKPLVKYRSINLYPTERRYWLKKNDFFLLGVTPHSYDSRYFGIINLAQIKARAILIWATT